MWSPIEERLVRASFPLGPFGPTWSESALASFERAHQLSLPEDYRSFLARIGDGGPGPGQGLSTVAADLDGNDCATARR